nr:hypothetical protein [Serratia marcescens]
MRQIIASAFVSLDGVMQAPGGQDRTAAAASLRRLDRPLLG